ncbi:hypothetical protein BB560_000477 [Smittium megazygosporum]|uniref:PPPDE domain-containing protein n=1 Tax=Smittium megazygosporum TaxID=133381 RepID=A0A2T9ZK85_9FUNG|nr:hypothetical protein BB560_000477 [Smittium megazygosporum]
MIANQTLEDSDQSPVKVYLYDLSRGLAKQFSLLLTGKQIDGIWHTSVVVYNREYYFGQGVIVDSPGQTQYGTPVEIIDMGATSIPRDVTEDLITELGQRWTFDKYHLFNNNCNHFSDELVQMLTGNSLPIYISELPNEFLSTPMGQNLMPMINSLYGNPPETSLPLDTAQKPQPIPSAETSSRDILSSSLRKNLFHIISNSDYLKFKKFLSAENFGLIIISDDDSSQSTCSTLSNCLENLGINAQSFFVDPTLSLISDDPENKKYNSKLNKNKFVLGCVFPGEIQSIIKSDYNITSNDSILFFNNTDEICRVYNINSESEITGGFAVLFNSILESLLKKSLKYNTSFTSKNLVNLLSRPTMNKLSYHEITEYLPFDTLLSRFLEIDGITVSHAEAWIDLIKSTLLKEQKGIEYIETGNQDSKIRNITNFAEFLFYADKMVSIMRSICPGKEFLVVRAISEYYNLDSLNSEPFYHMYEEKSTFEILNDFINSQIEKDLLLTENFYAELMSLVSVVLSRFSVFHKNNEFRGKFGRSPIAVSENGFLLNKNLHRLSHGEIFNIYNFVYLAYDQISDLCKLGSKLVSMFLLGDIKDYVLATTNNQNSSKIDDQKSKQTEALLKSACLCALWVSSTIYTIRLVNDIILDNGNIFNKFVVPESFPIKNVSLSGPYNNVMLESVVVEMQCAMIEFLGSLKTILDQKTIPSDGYLETLASDNKEYSHDKNQNIYDIGELLFSKVNLSSLTDILVSVGLLLQTDSENLLELTEALELDEILNCIKNELLSLKSIPYYEKIDNKLTERSDSKNQWFNFSRFDILNLTINDIFKSLSN